MKRALMIAAMVAVIGLAGTADANPVVTPAAGYDVTWDGNVGYYYDQAVPANLSLGGTPFSDGSLGAQNGWTFHLDANLNDGIYGNSNSWISDSDPDSFCGIDLGASYDITNVAWGRANITGDYTDRSLGVYTVQVTTEADPQTTGSWTTIGTVNNLAGGESLRHRYDVSTSGGDPIPATGVRLLSPNGNAIDELEINTVALPPPPPKIDIVHGWAWSPGPTYIPDARRSDFANTYDDNAGTQTYQTASGAVEDQDVITALDFAGDPGLYDLDRIRINDVGGNGGNGAVTYTVRYTTDTDADLQARSYTNVTGLAVVADLPGDSMPNVSVAGATVQHLDAAHDGYYSVTFDEVPVATGIELEWNNTGGFKHWTVREIEAYGELVPPPPAEPGEGLSLWLDASAIAGKSGGQTVGTWNDLSGNGNDATAVDTPSYETGQFKGGTMPGVYFDPETSGSGIGMEDGDYYTIADADSLDLPENHTLFVVMKMAAPISDSGYGGLACKTEGTAGYFPGYRHSITWTGRELLQPMVGDGTDSMYRNPNGQDNPIGTPAIVGVTRDASVAGFTQLTNYKNGAAATSSSDYASGSGQGSLANDAPLLIGRMHRPPNADPRELNAYIGEYILFERLLTAQEILDINAYLGLKWGIDVAPGGDPVAGRALLPAGVVPEPAGLGLIGLALLAVRRRRS